MRSLFFLLAAREPPPRADLFFLCKLHKFLSQKYPNFMPYFSPKTIDKMQKVWYNICVKREREKQTETLCARVRRTETYTQLEKDCNFFHKTS